MTPNKLPPLPHTWYVMKDEETDAFDAEHMRAYGRLSFDAGYAEALRQSQSLPAGAVDEGSVVVPKVLTPEMMKAIQRSTEVGAYICDNWSGAYNVLHELWHQAINAAPKQALQADAREKGEACRHDVFDSCEQCYVEPGSATAAAGKVNGYLFRQRAVEVIVDGEIPEWMSRQPGIRVTITPEGATHPAQASEADEVKRLRVALEDLLSWFPDKPAPAEWRLTAGDHGADAAIDAARAALATSSQETASD